MKNNNKVLSLIGLATKAGKIASGEFSTEKSVKIGKRLSGNGCGRRFREYKEEIPEYVCSFMKFLSISCG